MRNVHVPTGILESRSEVLKLNQAFVQVGNVGPREIVRVILRRGGQYDGGNLSPLRGVGGLFYFFLLCRCSRRRSRELFVSIVVRTAVRFNHNLLFFIMAALPYPGVFLLLFLAHHPAAGEVYFSVIVA